MSTNNPAMDHASESLRGLTDRVTEAKESISDMARATAAKVDESRATAADRLEGAASAVRDRAGDLPGGEKVQQLARGAAERLTTTADYVRRNDTTRMMADVETAVKDNPGPELLIAAAFGFLLGRALSRD